MQITHYYVHDDTAQLFFKNLQECRFTHIDFFYPLICLNFIPEGIYIYIYIKLPSLCPYICTCYHRDSLVGVATVDNCRPLTVASVLPPLVDLLHLPHSSSFVYSFISSSASSFVSSVFPSSLRNLFPLRIVTLPGGTTPRGFGVE